MSLWDQVNTSSNSMEQGTNEKHVPQVSVEKLSNTQVKVKVNVGGGKHPNEIDHWFQWVVLRVNELFVGKAEFSAVIMEPIAEFIINVKPGAVITARARCNKHGLWESDPITI